MVLYIQDGSRSDFDSLRYRNRVQIRRPVRADSGLCLALTVLGPNIDLTNAPGTLTNLAFSMPRNAVLRSMPAYFSTTVALALDSSSVEVHAQLYQSATSNNVFSPIPGAAVDLAPSLAGVLPVGTIASGVTDGLGIPITAGPRLLLVFSTTAEGVSLVQTVVGYASAGLAFD